MSGREKAFLKTLKGVIVGYHRGPKTQNPKECLIKFPGIETGSEAGRLIGRKVAWPVRERKCRGKIVKPCGDNWIKTRLQKEI